jgi:hypothetical protein
MRHEAAGARSKFLDRYVLVVERLEEKLNVHDERASLSQEAEVTGRPDWRSSVVHEFARGGRTSSSRIVGDSRKLDEVMWGDGRLGTSW